MSEFHGDEDILEQEANERLQAYDDEHADDYDTEHE